MSRLEDIIKLLEIYKIPEHIGQHIKAAYQREYFKISDGGTCVPDFFLGKVFEYNGVKQNPLFVTHDFLYEMVPKLYADIWLYYGMKSFGHKFMAPLFLIGLQTVGWPYYWGMKLWKKLKKK